MDLSAVRRLGGLRRSGPVASAHHGAPLRTHRDRAEVGGGLGGRGPVPGLRGPGRPPAAVLRARHVPVPLGRPAHGPRRGVQRRRRRRPVPGDAGHNVLHPIGWDAFGLPAENAAIKRGDPPEGVDVREHRPAGGARSAGMGMSFDWTRRLNTCDPEYYRWTQWLFLQLFERGLAYRKNAPTNWCPKDQTVLANEQVIQGACERCGTAGGASRPHAVVLQDHRLRAAAAGRHGRARPSGPSASSRCSATGSAGRRAPRSRSRSPRPASEVTVFTTRPDTLWGVTFFVFAPEHPLVQRAGRGSAARPEQVEPLREKVRSTPLTSREEADTKEGVPLGVHAVNPVNGERVPAFVGAVRADGVRHRRGDGGAGARPARLRVRTRSTACRSAWWSSPRRRAVDPDAMTEATPHEGVMVNSGPFDGERVARSRSRR